MARGSPERASEATPTTSAAGARKGRPLCAFFSDLDVRLHGGDLGEPEAHDTSVQDGGVVDRPRLQPVVSPEARRAGAAPRARQEAGEVAALGAGRRAVAVGEAAAVVRRAVHLAERGVRGGVDERDGDGCRVQVRSREDEVHEVRGRVLGGGALLVVADLLQVLGHVHALRLRRRPVARHDVVLDVLEAWDVAGHVAACGNLHLPRPRLRVLVEEGELHVDLVGGLLGAGAVLALLVGVHEEDLVLAAAPAADVRGEVAGRVACGNELAAALDRRGRRLSVDRAVLEVELALRRARALHQRRDVARCVRRVLGVDDVQERGPHLRLVQQHAEGLLEALRVVPVLGACRTAKRDCLVAVQVPVIVPVPHLQHAHPGALHGVAASEHVGDVGVLPDDLHHVVHGLLLPEVQRVVVQVVVVQADLHLRAVRTGAHHLHVEARDRQGLVALRVARDHILRQEARCRDVVLQMVVHLGVAKPDGLGVDGEAHALALLGCRQDD
mmetsp:Transcript_3897/g.10046  ORF Transcript_3897/g.10046 Transcript_3897/m.10046 type:complete len:499 (+) Transcript_3897:133-1629(+)